MKNRRVDVDVDVNVKKKVVTEKIQIKQTETKRLNTKGVVAKKDDKKKKSPLKRPRKVISAVKKVYRLNKTDAEIDDDANTPVVMALTKPDASTVVLQSATSVSSKNSDTSTLSAGSIEKRLSEMISPIKIATKTSTNHQSGKFYLISNKTHFELHSFVHCSCNFHLLK